MHLSCHHPHQQETDMSAHTLVRHAALVVRRLRTAGHHKAARTAAFEARREIGASLLRRSVA